MGDGSMVGTKVHHDRGGWNGVVIAVLGPKRIEVQEVTNGPNRGIYDLSEFSLSHLPKDKIKVIVTRAEFLDELKDRIVAFQPKAIAFLRENHHQHDVPTRVRIDQRVIDATLVGLVNFVGVQLNVDYALKTTDLPHPSLLEKIARAADVGPAPKEKKKKKDPSRPHGPVLTPELRAQATERAVKERKALNERSRPGGGRY